MRPAEMERFRKAEEIFHAALEKPAGEDRDRLIRETCGSDEGLRTAVDRLLANDERVRAAAPPVPERLPRFGAWQALKLLGRGGMGTVYLAERADGAFRMAAAVKVVPLALASPAIEERFRRERQFLAGLDHQKIARLIDGGVSGTGLPYLVMEFVDGPTIDRFCDAHRLDTRARVALFRQLLEALAYVHGRFVIHRDVKPSNILVNESGNVKLLDFGTARLVDATAEAAITKTGVFAFTPEYASPEQVRGEPLTIASDLYSSGVLLYRLLTGRLPRRIGTPPEPCRIDPRLDAIIRKALRKDAAGRYQSAIEMDADLARYLEGWPVSARKPGKKFWSMIAAGLVLSAASILGPRALRNLHAAHELVPFDAGVPNAMQPALSSNGKWLAVAAVPSSREEGAHTDIWIKPMPSGAARRVTNDGAANETPALSPDGQWLAYHSTRTPEGIYLQRAQGGAARLLVAGGRAPRFSPDGKWIAYLNTSENGGDIPAALHSRTYDLILADYHLSAWSGSEALEILRVYDADTPFILVTGTMGEEAAVECIKQGATDYVLKDRPARLPLAVKRALQESNAREERRRAERTRDLLASIVESSDDAIIGEALDGTIATWNLGAERTYGYTASEVRGMPVSLLFPPGSSEAPRAAYIRGDAGIDRFEAKGLRKDGEAIDVAVTVSPIHDIAGGSISGISIIVRDVTEHKRLQNEYYAAQKMEAVGRVAAGVAHDFNNLLTVIIGYGSLALARIDASDPLHQEIQEVRRAGERAAVLAHQLLAFSRKQVLQPKILDINAIVEDMDRMLRRVIGEDIELETVLDPLVGPVKVDPGQLGQVIMNLAVNARDAMPDGGKLRIATASVHVEESSPPSHLPVAPGKYAVLSVADEGTGMDAATQARIFEPFFTTKPEGQGTGLGLATVYGIVKQSGGEIQLSSELGQGATFEIYLPQVVRQAVAAPAPTTGISPSGGGETVLVVEDDDMVRTLTCNVLRKRGYYVLDAKNGGAALLLSGKHEGPIHLVLTDMVLPTTNGGEMAAQMKALRPATRILFVSGYAAAAVAAPGREVPANAAYLAKPFTAEALASKVREVLDAV